MNVIIITGNKYRHNYFRKKISNDKRINVLASYCEEETKIKKQVFLHKKENFFLRNHLKARLKSEEDFFKDVFEGQIDNSPPIIIKKGDINMPNVVENIIKKNPDLLVCYGSSLIKSKLLEFFKDRFLNIHLGLSPYYRGSGTNVWPLINNQPQMVGATFMHIDEGIDTGRIIHQINADIFLGDNPHTIGNRLIKKMTLVTKEVIYNFKSLDDISQPNVKKSLLYLKKDFDEDACRKLYDNFNSGMIENFIREKKKLINLVQNKKLI